MINVSKTPSNPGAKAMKNKVSRYYKNYTGRVPKKRRKISFQPLEFIQKAISSYLL